MQPGPSLPNILPKISNEVLKYTILLFLMNVFKHIKQVLLTSIFLKVFKIKYFFNKSQQQKNIGWTKTIYFNDLSLVI